MYRGVVLTTFKEELAYKTEFLVSLVGSVIQLTVLWFLWNAIFKAYGSDLVGGFTLPMMITYVSISTIIGLYNRSVIEYLIEEDVKTGFISMILTKPFSYPLYYMFREIGKIGFYLLTRGVVIALISFLILNIAFPVSPLFFLCMLLGFFINFFIVFLTGLWSFWSSGSIWGIRYARVVISEILSGSIIPIFLFPSWLQQISYLLPFQAIYSVPLLVYVGRVTGTAILGQVLIQLFWILILGSFSLFVWKRAEKKAIVQGG